MSKILMGGGEIPRFDEHTLCGMFAFRHEVFFKKLGWDVETHGNLEYDLFDTFNPVYMVAKDDKESIEGCWRLLPTTGSYMLRDTFPQLLRGEEIPCDKQIWELSRFAVDASSDGGNMQAPLNSLTMGMIRNLYDFAVSHQIDQFVTVTSVALERLLKRTGLPIRRFGDGKAQRVGRVLTVACWVEINEQFANVVYPDTGVVERAA
jgi:acyl homoserine lactone synthase